MHLKLKTSLLFSFALSLCLAHYFYVQKFIWRLPSAKILKPVQITGVIASIPEEKSHGKQFVFNVTGFEKEPVKAMILLTWYQHPPFLQIGQQWQIFVKLKPPIGLHNPGGFDYQKWLAHQGFSATGYVISKKNHQLLGISNQFWLPILRERIEKAINQAVQDEKMAAILSALSVGLRDQLTQKDWQVFQHTGTSHLVAISGLHIGLVASCTFVLFQFIWRQFPRLLLVIPAIRVGQFASIVSALVYTALSGFALPAQRALMMIVCFMLSEMLSIRFLFYRRLFVALFFVVLLAPCSIFSASFGLSFFAVIILGYLLCARLRSHHGIQSTVIIQVSLCIGLFPITLYYFGQVSLVSLLSNAVAIPWVSFISVPSVLLGVCAWMCGLSTISIYLFKISGWLLKPLWIFLSFLSDRQYAFWQHSIPSVWILILSMLAVFLILLPKGFPAKWLGCAGFFPLFFFHVKQPNVDEFWLTVLDVGQGLSVIVQTAKHVLIYDTGVHVPDGFDAGKSVVLPFLNRSNIKTVDLMVISHGDNDHSGGAAAIVKALPVSKVFTSAPRYQHLFKGQFCHDGQHWVWDGIQFQIISPFIDEPYQDNNSSCVLKVSSKTGSVLLTGDIERSQEITLVNKKAPVLASAVLVVAHHGSRTSSSLALLKSVQPHDAIMSLGAYNRYHFPASSVVKRFEKLGVNVYTTAKNGAIKVRFLRTTQVVLPTRVR